MYHLSYQKNNNTYYIQALGKTNAIMLVEVVEYIIQKAKHKDLRVITDYRKTTIDQENIKDANLIVDSIKEKLIPNFTSIKWASLSIDYRATTLGLILKELLKDEAIDYETCTTERKICQWMGIDSIAPEHFVPIER